MLRCLKRAQEAPDVHTYSFEYQPSSRGKLLADYAAGQYGSFEFDGLGQGNQKNIMRTWTISSPPAAAERDNAFTLTIKNVSDQLPSCLTLCSYVQNVLPFPMSLGLNNVSPPVSTYYGSPLQASDIDISACWLCPNACLVLVLAVQPMLVKQVVRASLVAQIGLVSGWLAANMEPGRTISFKGFEGIFTPGDCLGDQGCPEAGVLLLAGGIGITPLRAMLPELLQRGCPVTLLYSVRDLQDAVFLSEFAEVRPSLSKLLASRPSAALLFPKVCAFLGQ